MVSPLAFIVVYPYTHIFFLQVLGESLCLTADYLVREGRAVTANSRAEATKPKNLRLRKDMIEAMDQASEAKANLKEVSDQLKIEKMLIIKKDEEIQLAMLKIGDEHEKVVVDFQALESFGIIIFGKFFKGFELLR